MKSWAASLFHGRNHDTQTFPSSFPWRHLCISHFGGGPCSWGIPSSPQSHHTWSLSALEGGKWKQLQTTNWKYFPPVQASWGAQKANIRNSDRQCSSGMENARGRTSTRNWQEHGDGSRSRAEPAWGLAAAAPMHSARSSVMLEPGMGHLHPLLRLEDDFAPSGLWQWQLREMQAKGTTKYLGFSHVVEHSLPLQQEHWGGACICLVRR